MYHRHLTKIIIAVFMFLSVSNYSHSVLTNTGPSYYCLFMSGFAINAVHNKLYLTIMSATNNLMVFDLNPTTGTMVTGTPMQTLTVPGNGSAGLAYLRAGMALDAMKKKLYIGCDTGTIQIYNISDTGTILTPPTFQSHRWGTWVFTNLYIDFIHNLLVSCSTGNGVVISHLGSDGMPTDTGTVYTFGGGAYYAMAADYSWGKLYIAQVGNGGSRIDLDGNGLPLTATNSYNTYGGDFNVVLDSANKRIYFTEMANGSYIRMWRLSDAGVEESYDTLTPPAYGLAIDPVRRKMFVGGAFNSSIGHIAYYNLDADGKPFTLIDSGTYMASGAGGGLAYEPFYNKIYMVTSANAYYLLVYSGPDSPLVPIQINNGESLTETPYITLKFQAANPNFIYVSGDLLSISTPVNDKDKWISCGGGFWKNTGDTMRASTLNVSSVLSAGLGEKTIEVWYCGSTTGHGDGQSYWYSNSNFTGMMRKATAKITLIESASSVLSLALSRIDYSGARIDYTVKDGRNRNVNIDVQYKTSKKDWTNATAGGDATGTGGEGKTNLTASLAGISHYYIWDIEKDIEENAKDVQVRIKANNADKEGTWIESGKYSVPEWTGSDIKSTNASIKKPDGSWLYRVRLEWTGVADTAGVIDTTTTYEVQKREDTGSWSWVTVMSGTLVEIENLSDSPVYSFKVRIRTKEGLFSAYSKETKIKLVRRQYAKGLIGKEGGKVFIEDYDEIEGNNARIEIEAGVFKEDIEVTLERLQGGNYEINGKRKASGINLVETDFKKAVTLKLAYSREEVEGFGWREDNLSVYYFDGINWICIGGIVDKTNCLVTAKVNHFSKFRIAESTVRPVIQILPDCFTPNNDGINDMLRFYFSSQDMVDKAQIKTYDINGKIIRFLKTDGINTFYWDGKDESGRLCETGVYICIIETSGKKLTKSVSLVR